MFSAIIVESTKPNVQIIKHLMDIILTLMYIKVEFNHGLFN